MASLALYLKSRLVAKISLEILNIFMCATDPKNAPFDDRSNALNLMFRSFVDQKLQQKHLLLSLKGGKRKGKPGDLQENNFRNSWSFFVSKGSKLANFCRRT